MRYQIHQMSADAIKRGADEDFAHYLHDEVIDRMDRGQSFDCDAFRCLYELARKRPLEAAA